MKGRIIALATALAVCFPGASAGQAPRGRTEQPRQPVVVNVSEGGFRWGDAAIGAAAASGAALALAGMGMFRGQLRKEER
jgi:hypothetical protein